MDQKTMRVHEIASLANVAPEIVRYYSRIGLIKPQKDRKNGYKLFGRDDISRLDFIRKAKNLGYTLKEIKKILSHASSGASPCPIVRRIIENRLDENRARLDGMITLQSRMESAIEQWKRMPDGVPDGNSVCVLIESFSSNF